jgi:hypothetical protein
MALEPGFNSATQVDWELACERETVIRPLSQAVRLDAGIPRVGSIRESKRLSSKQSKSFTSVRRDLE